jgi:hypothetical protein
VRRIKPGDLIVWTNGSVGIITEKVDIYKHNGVTSRSRIPAWRWLITFSGDLPYNYSELWGISEDLLLSGEYGEIIYQE